MRTTNWDQVRQRLLALHEQRAAHDDDPAATTLAAPLAAPLTEAQVDEAERQFGITFPADYRDFLLKVSAGGHFPRELRPGPSGWHWADDEDTDLTRLGTPFPDHDTAWAAADEHWDNAPREEDHDTTEDWLDARAAWSDAAEAAERDRVTGAMFLKGHGHNFSALLIVTGPHRGEMWFDGRPTCDRLNPLLTDEGRPAGFTDWYLDWLRHEERLITPEQQEADRRRRRVGKETPIWLRWFDTWGEENCGH
ncbi:SMI1/KNR4 family protein [Kitasatospora sp. NPDC089509]|uniref:SMI1/KNR4 family protein n=1 Tax=Kitasatospora sp. NPDC089509 TaxID=3364079 RepID=UPI00381A5B80